LGRLFVTVSYGGYVEIVTLLLENGADINVRDDANGTTPLMNAVMGGHPEVIQVLLKRGADPNIEVGKDKDGKGITALTYARIRNDPKIILLLEEVSAR
jgi:uncharacterized protein